jgi:hypothetical protein
MNLRQKKIVSFDSKQTFSNEFNFTILQKEFISVHNNKKYKFYEVDKVSDVSKNSIYKLHTLQSLSIDCNTNENEILKNPSTVREFICQGDILYCIKSLPSCYYLQFCNYIGEVYNLCLENKNPQNFVFIPFTLYQPSICFSKNKDKTRI